MRTVLTSIVIMVAAVFVNSCSSGLTTVEPGRTVTTSRTVGEFDRLEVSRSIRCTYIVGNPTGTVSITVPEGFVDHIIVKVENNTLILDVDENIDVSNFEPKDFVVTTPVLKYIGLSGGSRVTSNDTVSTETFDLALSGGSIADLAIVANDIRIDASGGSTIALRGESDTFRTNQSGGSIVNAFDMVTRECTANLSGASILSITATEELNVTASGASLVSYKGRPKIFSDLTGGSTVQDDN